MLNNEVDEKNSIRIPVQDEEHNDSAVNEGVCRSAHGF